MKEKLEEAIKHIDAAAALLREARTEASATRDDNVVRELVQWVQSTTQHSRSLQEFVKNNAK